MQVRWSPDAYADLLSIGKHIRRNDPEIALRVVNTMYAAAVSLNSFPHRGRKGRVAGTRELPLPPLPFIIVYRVVAEAV